ncbi:MAG: tetratricopeptide repeat protein [Alphaproteobacteria bacterium]|nr:tetratricopeptide repeat protein [Alphaproteobacteria bacterium]MCL2505117.1 tetratricopeptide repeat protein [Alphaproteobacteria bacterium]
MNLLQSAIEIQLKGDLLEAESLYRQAIGQNPKDADAYSLLGTNLATQKRHEEAIECINEALSLDNTSGLFYSHKGNVLMAANRIEESIEAFRKAIELTPDVDLFHFNLGNALRVNKDYKGAIKEYEKSLELNPKHILAMNNLVLSLVEEKKLKEALSYAYKIVFLVPNYAEGWATVSNVEEKLKNYKKAEEAAEKALELDPKNLTALFGYGIIMHRLNRPEEAVRAYQKALSIDNTKADFWHNLSMSYRALNKLEDAETAARKVVETAGEALDNDDDIMTIDETKIGERHFSLALAELLQGKYEKGFARYRARFKAIETLTRREMPAPLWQGESLKGKEILICHEQGYGDTIMMARFFPIVKEMGARIIFKTERPLLRLMQTMDSIDEVIASDMPDPKTDFYCHTFDLPYILKTNLETLPKHAPYINIDSIPDNVAIEFPEKLKVGIVWGGSHKHKNDTNRSISLEVFSKLLDAKGATFYSLTKDLKSGDSHLFAELLKSGKIKHHIGPHLKDFVYSGKIINRLDLVISCDTATAHLAGALGKPVWILLPFDADWRWLADREDSVWYPTARLFRQPSPGDWDSAIAKAKEALEMWNE